MTKWIGCKHHCHPERAVCDGHFCCGARLEGQATIATHTCKCPACILSGRQCRGCGLCRPAQTTRRACMWQEQMRTPRVCPMLSGGRASLWSAQHQAGAGRSRLQRVESIQLHIYFFGCVQIYHFCDCYQDGDCAKYCTGDTKIQDKLTRNRGH